MAKETKIGLTLCVLLIGAFAFVVYSKMQKQRLEEDYVVSDDDGGPFQEDGGPFQEDEAPLPDFGGEPGHDHGHDHSQHAQKSTFSEDDRSTDGNFDIPQRTAGREGKRDFQRVEELRKRHQRQHGADGWEVKPVADQHRDQHAHPEDNPFAQTAHKHAHDDETPAPFGSDAADDFGPPEQQTTPPKQKTVDITEFLKSRKNKDTAQAEELPQPAGDEPFGLEPIETVQTDTHRHQSEPVDGFNPFDSPDPDEGRDFGGKREQHSAGRAAVGDHRQHEREHAHQHSHEHSHDAFGAESSGDPWSSEQPDDHAHAVDTEQSGKFQAGSTTNVEPWDDTDESFGSFDDPQQAGPGPVHQDENFDGGFGDVRAAPRPRGHGRHAPPGEGIHQHDAVPDQFSEPFDDLHQEQHGPHGHAHDGRIIPDSLPDTNDDHDHGHGDRPGIYVARRGDNFWNISKQQYGAGRYYKLLALYNKDRIPNPRKLRPGMKVLVPRPETLEIRYPALCPWRTDRPLVDHHGADGAAGFFVDSHGHPGYRVGKRDTLTAIAHVHLGRSSRWKQVYALNRDRIRNPRRLKIGTILRLPADASRVDLVRRSGGHGGTDVESW